MDISSLMPFTQLQGITEQSSSLSVGGAGKPPPPPPPPPSDSLELSETGSLASMLAELDEADQLEMQEFHEQMRTAVASGGFDAAAMAAAAPDAMQTFADENGIDLEEMLSDMSGRMQHRAQQLPPALMAYSQNGMGGSGQNQAMDTLMQLLEGVGGLETGIA